LACNGGDISAISSRKIVPPSASSKRPMRVLLAPVNAPFSWPNSSLSSRVSGIAAQFTLIIGPVARKLHAWMTSARISLPTPLSPVISTRVSDGAISDASWKTACMSGLRATT
jgi:hypothetical protein